MLRKAWCSDLHSWYLQTRIQNLNGHVHPVNSNLKSRPPGCPPESQNLLQQGEKVKNRTNSEERFHHSHSDISSYSPLSREGCWLEFVIWMIWMECDVCKWTIMMNGEEFNTLHGEWTRKPCKEAKSCHVGPFYHEQCLNSLRYNLEKHRTLSHHAQKVKLSAIRSPWIPQSWPPSQFKTKIFAKISRYFGRWLYHSTEKSLEIPACQGKRGRQDSAATSCAGGIEHGPFQNCRSLPCNDPDCLLRHSVPKQIADEWHPGPFWPRRHRILPAGLACWFKTFLRTTVRWGPITTWFSCDWWQKMFSLHDKDVLLLRPQRITITLQGFNKSRLVSTTVQQKYSFLTAAVVWSR